MKLCYLLIGVNKTDKLKNITCFNYCFFNFKIYKIFIYCKNYFFCNFNLIMRVSYCKIQLIDYIFNNGCFLSYFVCFSLNLKKIMFILGV